MDKIKEMLQLQQQLNDTTNGIGWENGVTKNGKLIDWKRCAYLECAELIDSYPWKHWKNIDAAPDYENIKIESVDIWHFVMSLLLQEYKNNHLGGLDKISGMIQSVHNYADFLQGQSQKNSDYYEQIAIAEKLLKSIINNNSLPQIVSAFVDVAIQSGLTLDLLYQLYIGKNILNQFRQDNGYKEGSYIKIWDGREDNVVMQEILGANSSITPTQLYDALTKHYPINSCSC